MGVSNTKLPTNLLKRFAKQVSTENDKEQSTTFYGTVVSKDDTEIQVKLDGSDRSTPVDCTMDAENGDRVMIQIKDHKAVIVGNSTSPASARSANAYMKLVDDGLVIGNLNGDADNNKSYLLLRPRESDDESFMDCGLHILKRLSDGTDLLIASFEEDNVQLSTSKNGECNLSLGPSNIISLNEGLSIQGPMDTNSSIYVGGRHEIGEGENMPIFGVASIDIEPKTSDENQYSRIVIRAATENRTYDGQNEQSEIEIRNDGIFVQSPQVTINYSKVVTRDDIFPIYKESNIEATGSIEASGYATVTSPSISVPTGYSLLGIRAISQDYHSPCHLTRFGTNLTDKKCWATFHNTSSSEQKLNVIFYYFCIRSS